MSTPKNVNEVTTFAIWQPLECFWIDKDPEVDVIVVTVKGGGQEYVITCAGHKGMTPREFIDALRAATAVLIRAAGADTNVVGATSPDAAQFDTGDQRAS